MCTVGQESLEQAQDLLACSDLEVRDAFVILVAALHDEMIRRRSPQNRIDNTLHVVQSGSRDEIQHGSTQNNPKKTKTSTH